MRSSKASTYTIVSIFSPDFSLAQQNEMDLNNLLTCISDLSKKGPRMSYFSLWQALQRFVRDFSQFVNIRKKIMTYTFRRPFKHKYPHRAFQKIVFYFFLTNPECKLPFPLSLLLILILPFSLILKFKSEMKILWEKEDFLYDS